LKAQTMQASDDKKDEPIPTADDNVDLAQEDLEHLSLEDDEEMK